MTRILSGALVSAVLFTALGSAAPAKVPSKPPAAPRTRTYAIAVMSLVANTIRSGHSVLVGTSKSGNRDTLYSNLSVKIGSAAIVSAKRWGPNNVPSGGKRSVNQTVIVTVRDSDVVKITYAVTNDGHNHPQSSSASVQAFLNKQLNSIEDQDVYAISDLTTVDIPTLTAREKNALLGTQLATSLGSTALGQLAGVAGGLVGYFAVDGWNGIFPDCDGPVAGSTIVSTGAALRKSIATLRSDTIVLHSAGTNSPGGCGKNSSYDVTVRIRARN